MDKVILITQARLGSSRLPGKILKMVDGRSLLEIHIDRLKKCKNISELIIATTKKEEDNCIIELSKELDVNSFRGSELDVLDRFFKCAKSVNADWIVRVTSDCPLIDPKLVDSIINYSITNDVDYCSNTLIENFPDGQDVEVFKFDALKDAWKNAILNSEREHVTPFIRNNSDFMNKDKFKAINYDCENNYSNIRMTVDELNDFLLIKILIENLGVKKSWREYVDYIISEDLITINSGIIRNEGYIKSIKEDKNG